MSCVQSLISDVRNRRKELGVPDAEPVSIEVHPRSHPRDDYVRRAFSENQDVIQKLARVSAIKLSDAELQGPGTFHHLDLYSAKVDYEATIDVPAERERHKKDIAKLEKNIASSQRQLGNEAFLAKAPPAIVEGLKKQEVENRLLLEKAKAALAALPPE